MNRKKKQSRPQAKEAKTTSMVGHQPKLMGAIEGGSDTFSGVNKLVISAAPLSIAASVQNYQINIAELINVSSDILDPLLSDTIDAWSSQRGYTSNVTASDIRDYLVYSSHALSALYVLKRSQNVKNLRDGLGHDVSELFTSVPAGGSNDVVYDAYDSMSNTATSLGDGNISNAEWANDYLSELAKIRIPQAFGELTKSLFEGVYKNEMGQNDSYMEFWPSHIVAPAIVRTPETSFANGISGMDALIASKPDITSIMNFLGFNADFAVNEDWTRDLSGQSLTVYNDPMMYTFITNNWQSVAGLSESDLPQEIQDTVFVPFAGSGLMSYQDYFTLGYDLVPYTILFRATSTDLSLGLNNYSADDGTVYHSKLLPSVRVNIPNGITATGRNRFFSLSTGMLLFDRFNGCHIPYAIQLDYNDVDGTSLTESVSSTYALYGFDAFHLSEAEQEGIVDIYLVNLMLGPDYRANIKAKIASLQGFVSRG